MERVCAKLLLCELQDISRAKMRKVPGTDAGALKLATGLVNEHVRANFSLSTELVPMKKAWATAQKKSNRARDILTLLQQSMKA